MSTTTHHYAIFSSLYYPHPGGVEVFTDNLARELATEGHRATIVTMRIDDSPAYEQLCDGVDVHRLPCRSLFEGRLPWTVRTKAYDEAFGGLLDAGIDRVLVNTRFYPHSLEGLRLASLICAPAVVLDHGSAHICFGNALDPIVELYEHAITRRVRSYQPRFYGISHMSVEWLRHFGIEARGVIPNAIDASAFRASSSGRDYRRELGIEEGRPLVSFVGRLTPEKGPDILLRVARQMDDSAFLLAGAGVLHDQLVAEKTDNVFLLGAVGREDLSALMAQSDFFCLPSRSEGFCTSLLEAGAYGVPFVVPDVGGASEVAGDSDAARITAGRTSGEMLAALEGLMSLSTEKLSQAKEELQAHVERDCSWGESAMRLDDAFSE